MATDFRFKRSIAVDAKPLSLLFEGQSIPAFEAESVAAALLANGIDFTRTTPVNGSARAPFCMMGTCFDCLMEINHIPNRQACMETVSDGMVIHRMLGAREIGVGE